MGGDGADGGAYSEEEYPHKELTEAIIGAAIEVHRVLGPGYIERIYQNALILELAARGHDVQRQQKAEVSFRGKPVGWHRFGPLVDNEIILELKSVTALAEVHVAQLRSTLKAAGKRVGLLLNFNQRTLTSGLRRVIN